VGENGWTINPQSWCSITPVAFDPDAEPCLAVLTLVLLVIRLADGLGLIRNNTWRRSRALLEHSAAGPLNIEMPTIMKVFRALPYGCRPVRHRMRHLWRRWSKIRQPMNGRARCFQFSNKWKLDGYPAIAVPPPVGFQPTADIWARENLPVVAFDV
jgi:hypothetical protein